MEAYHQTTLTRQNSGMELTGSGCEFRLPGRVQGRLTAHIANAQRGTYCQSQEQTATAQPGPLYTSQHNPLDTHFLALEPLVHGIARSTDSLALELTLLSTCQHRLLTLA